MLRRFKKSTCLIIVMSLFVNPSTTIFASTSSSTEAISRFTTDGSWMQENNNWMYISSGNQKTIGWKKIQGSWYYFNSTGVMLKNWQSINGKWYFFNSEGTMETGWKTINNVTYYLKSDGSMSIGWEPINGKWYFFDSNGAKSFGWIKLADTWYFLKSDGSMTTGFYTINNKKYYFDEKGGMKTSWQKLNNHWYYFDPVNGDMKTSWQSTKSGWYYFNESGIMLTNWLKSGNTWYYLNDQGCMLVGWQKVNDNWYYFESNGSMAETWKQIDGKWYYLRPGHGDMFKGWLQLGTTWYYLSPDGSMATGSRIIDGKTYYFNSSGAWLPAGPDKSKKLIVVDPGHNHGGDYGSESFHDGVKYAETDLDMKVALRVKANLEKKGYEVLLTRNENDRFYDNLALSLMKRYSFANNSNADLFISLHHDSSDNSSAKGISTHYSTYRPNIDNEGVITGNDPNGWYSGVMIDTTPSYAAIKSKELANSIALGLSFQMGYVNRQSHDHNLKVTVNTNMPSLLVECGFISNREEAIRSSTFSNQEKMGQVISDSVSSII